MFNFTIHEIHCQRNIGVCPICKEPFPKSDMETHMTAEHCQVSCRLHRPSETAVLAVVWMYCACMCAVTDEHTVTTTYWFSFLSQVTCKCNKKFEKMQLKKHEVSLALGRGVSYQEDAKASPAGITEPPAEHKPLWWSLCSPQLLCRPPLKAYLKLRLLPDLATCLLYSGSGLRFFPLGTRLSFLLGFGCWQP